MPPEYRKSLLPFYIHDTLLFIAVGMYPIAIPSQILAQYHSIAALFWFNAIWPLVFILLMVPIFNLGVRTWSPRWNMILGTVVLIIFFVAIGPLIRSGPLGTIVGSLLMGVQISFYWLTRHWLVALHSTFASVGQQTGRFQSLRILAGVAGPLGCGFLYGHGYTDAPLYVAALMTALSLVPLFFLGTPPDPENHAIENRWQAMQRPELLALRRIFSVDGLIENFTVNAWQVAFLLFLGTRSSLGYVLGISALGAVLLAHLGGVIFDRRHRTRLLFGATVSRMLTSSLYLTLSIVHPLWFITAVDTVARYSLTVLRTTVESYVFGSCHTVNPLAVHLAREYWLNWGRAGSAVVLAIGFTFWDDSWIWYVIAVGVLCQIVYFDLRRCERWLK